MSDFDHCGWCGLRFVRCYGIVDLAWCRMHSACEVRYVDALFTLQCSRVSAAESGLLSAGRGEDSPGQGRGETTRAPGGFNQQGGGRRRRYS
jgi:hypothetical protein